MRSIYYRFYWFILKLLRSNIIARIVIELAAFLYYSIFRRGKSFNFQGKKYNYFYHLYNRTIASERIIEIPIAKAIVNDFEGKQILEIGNVLSNYFNVDHDILDKYEKGKGVINQDVVDFKSNKKYDLIISVSTMEHVGWTYGEKKDPTKFLKGIKNVRRFLKKGGKMMITFPLYYRDDLSILIKSHKMPFNKEYFMKRTSFWNEWAQVPYKEAIRGASYDSYYANANVLYIGILDN